MFNELSGESFRIPWLIWIQLFVLFLLFALFFCFTISYDDDNASVSASVLPETSSVSAKSFRFEEIQRIEKPLLTGDNDSITPVSTNGQHRDITLKGGQNLSIKGEIETCSSMSSEELLEEEESSKLSSHHPCNFLQLATVAFLKCFGLDDTFGTSSEQKRRIRKTS